MQQCQCGSKLNLNAARFGNNFRNLLGRLLEFVGLQMINEEAAPKIGYNTALLRCRRAIHSRPAHRHGMHLQPRQLAQRVLG